MRRPTDDDSSIYLKTYRLAELSPSRAQHPPLVCTQVIRTQVLRIIYRAWTMNELSQVETDCVRLVKTKLPQIIITDKNCNDRCILRFARARELDVDATVDMMVKWKEWRVEAEIDDITEVSVQNEIASGKAYFHGFDKKGSACCIVRPRLHDPTARDINEVMRFGVFLLEKGITLSEEKGMSDQICVLYDRRGFEYRNFDRELFGVGKNLLSMLQDNYAERLGTFYVLGTNWLYWVLFKIISVFLTQRMKNKIKLVELVELPLYFEYGELPPEYTIST